MQLALLKFGPVNILEVDMFTNFALSNRTATETLVDVFDEQSFNEGSSLFADVLGTTDALFCTVK